MLKQHSYDIAPDTGFVQFNDLLGGKVESAGFVDESQQHRVLYSGLNQFQHLR
jgi:hypothetical protein